MPELPEVETTLRGIKPYLLHAKVQEVIIRHPRLRWPIPADLKVKLEGQQLLKLERRGKYLLFHFAIGTVLLHLGMSGSVRILTEKTPPQKHDHVDIFFNNHHGLRFTDPRRFGALLFTSDDFRTHPLLANIGPEPLSAAFNGKYLWQCADGKKVSVKSFVMNSHIVAGVGNIYAVEALFHAGIRPETASGKISLSQYKKLAASIKFILKKAIKKGGTTLKDFTRSDGSPGYFSLELQVYGRGGKACYRCKTKLKALRMGQRSTVYCPRCQK